MVDWIEIGGVGHPRLIPILPTTSKIDLLYEYVICAVATQGAYGIDEWTTKYKILLSMDGTTMVTYQENNVNGVCFHKIHVYTHVHIKTSQKYVGPRTLSKFL